MHFVSVKKKERFMNFTGTFPKLLLSMMKIDKRAQPISERDMGSYYTSKLIHPWLTDQMGIILDVTTKESLLITIILK